MQAPLADPTPEIKHLRRCMNDLVSVLALPAVWKGCNPSEILHTLVESLMKMLSLDFLYGRVFIEPGQAPFEVLRIDEQCRVTPDQITLILRECLNEEQTQVTFQRRLGDQVISILPVRMGVEGELGFIAAGCHRAEFPEQTERLILNVAANQAAIGIQQAQLLGEQKRVARELDDRIAQRTADLEAANRVLTKEIAERKRIEQRLRESETFLLEAQRLSRTGSWKHNLSSNRVSMTPEMERILAIEQGSSLPAELLFSTIHPEDRDRETANYLKAITEKCDFESDYRILLPNGSIRYIHNSGHPQLDEAGQVIGFTGTAIDLTEQHEIRLALQNALAEIKKSEAKLWQVIDTIPIIAWSNLTDGSNEFLNKKWTEHTGMSFEESHGWGWTAAMHPDDLPVLMKKWQAALISGQADEVEGRFRRRDGVYRWFLIRAEPFRDESGKIIRWFGTSTDIDDRKRAEDASIFSTSVG